MDDLLIIPGSINTFTKRVDGSYKITFETQEYSNDGSLDKFQHKTVLAVFTEKMPSTESIEAIKDSEITIKSKKKWSKSQVLRFAIRDLQIRQGREDESQEAFYENAMNRLIELINNKDKWQE